MVFGKKKKKFCESCGDEIPEQPGFVHCPRCGHKLGESVEVKEEPTIPAPQEQPKPPVFQEKKPEPRLVWCETCGNASVVRE